MRKNAHKYLAFLSPNCFLKNGPCWSLASSIPNDLIATCCLYCTVLYCTVLYCTVLYCTVLYCTVLKLTKCTYLDRYL